MSEKSLLSLWPNRPTHRLIVSGQQESGGVDSPHASPVAKTEDVNPSRDETWDKTVPINVVGRSRRPQLIGYPFSEEYLRNMDTATNNVLMDTL